MGGEKPPTNCAPCPVPGSPPRGRGKDIGGHPFAMVRRITPAWAGKSLSGLKKGPAFKDHPRVGGEKKSQNTKKVKRQGSPPRGRGKVRGANSGPPAPRITPAWAGKRATPTKNGCSGGDHPRVGGEKRWISKRLRSRAGSPPRGRGKDPSRCPPLRPRGITPAWAGKRSLRCSPWFTSVDHPRVGGEKTKKIP